MKTITKHLVRTGFLFAGLTFTSAAFVNCSSGKFGAASTSVAVGSPASNGNSETSMFTESEGVPQNGNQASGSSAANGSSSTANGSSASGSSLNNASGSNSSVSPATNGSSSGASAGSDSGVNPKIQFFVMVNGVSSSDMYIDQVIYGIVNNSSKEATYGCATLVERLPAGCSDESQWVKLPNQEWSYDDARQAWVMQKNISYFMPADKQGIMFLRDRKTNRTATAYLLLKSRPQAAVRYFYSGAVIGPCQKSPTMLAAEAAGACNANTLGQSYTDSTNSEVSCRATYTCVAQ